MEPVSLTLRIKKPKVKRLEGHNLDLQVAKSVTPVKVRHKQVTLSQGQIKVKLLGEITQGHTKSQDLIQNDLKSD